MIDAAYNKFLAMTGDPVAAAMLTLAEVIEGKPERVALSVKEAAKSLGISIGSLYDLCKAGKLKHQRFGRTIRVRPEDLENFKTDTASGGRSKLRFLKV